MPPPCAHPTPHSGSVSTVPTPTSTRHTNAPWRLDSSSTPCLRPRKWPVQPAVRSGQTNGAHAPLRGRVPCTGGWTRVYCRHVAASGRACTTVSALHTIRRPRGSGTATTVRRHVCTHCAFAGTRTAPHVFPRVTWRRRRHTVHATLASLCHAATPLCLWSLRLELDTWRHIR